MSLASLLGLQQATSVGAPDPVQEDPDIEVVGDPFRLENPGAIAQRDIARDTAENTAEHKGMFGTKGTLRDILGLVGDAFLVQSGNNAIYQPKRQQERMSDAMAGFTEGGQRSLEAIERVAGINPAAAQAMMEQYQANQYRTNQNSVAGMRAATSSEDLNRKNLVAAMDYVSQAYAAAVASGDPVAMTKAEQLANLVSQQFKIPVDKLGVTPGMTPQEAAVLAGRGATANQNLRLPQYERGLDLREESVNISRQRANEQGRANKSREQIQREAERGRTNRANQTDNRVRELDDGDSNSGGQRSLRGSDSAPASAGRVISRRRIQQ